MVASSHFISLGLLYCHGISSAPGQSNSDYFRMMTLSMNTTVMYVKPCFPLVEHSRVEANRVEIGQWTRVITENPKNDRARRCSIGNRKEERGIKWGATARGNSLHKGNRLAVVDSSLLSPAELFARYPTRSGILYFFPRFATGKKIYTQTLLLHNFSCWLSIRVYTLWNPDRHYYCRELLCFLQRYITRSFFTVWFQTKTDNLIHFYLSR